MRAVILTGGRGERLMPLTQKTLKLQFDKLLRMQFHVTRTTSDVGANFCA